MQCGPAARWSLVRCLDHVRPSARITVSMLTALPRLRLATLPTPLQDAVNLRAALGGPERAPRILIKRDDLTGLAFGGNKVRKLEYLVAEAKLDGCSTLV